MICKKRLTRIAARQRRNQRTDETRSIQGDNFPPTKRAHTRPDYSADRTLDESTPSEYASQGQGADTFVDYDFGAAKTIGGIIYQDRPVDNITALNVIFSQNATFGDADDVTVPYTPANPGGVNQIDLAALGQANGVSAQFVRLDVTAVVGGTNIGFREVEFFEPASVPEPGTLSVFGAALGLLIRRRRA